MKNLLFLLLLSPIVAFSQGNLDDISSALRTGDATALGNYFGSTVEIAVLNTEDRYRKADATQLMKNFFGKFQPGSYKQVHRGTSKGGDLQYAIGEMRSGGTTFRVYMLLKDVPGGYEIQQLNIDKE
jgi:hypothetical protein